MAVPVAVTVAAACIGAVVLLALLLAGFVEDHHVRPDLEDVGGMRKVHHVGSISSRRAHVYLQADVVTLLAEALAVAVQLEEFQVDEAALYAEGLDRAAADRGKLGRDRLVGPVAGLGIGVDDLHYGRGENAVVLEYRLAFSVVDRVVTHQETRYELLDDESAVVVGVGQEPVGELRPVVDLEGPGSAHSAVGFGDDGESGLLDECLHLRLALRALDLAGGRDAAKSIVLLHLGLVADGGHAVALDAGSDVEVGAQTGVLLQPVFVVGLDPVYLAVFVGEPGDGAVHFAVILEVVDFVIVVQCAAELVVEFMPGRVRDAQHVRSVRPEVSAEMAVGLREMWGNENDVHKRIYLIFCGYLPHLSVRYLPGEAVEFLPAVPGDYISPVGDSVE